MSAISSMGGSSSDIRTDYLKLLITQLQNQNPLEPMDNNQMATQLTQLSQLEQVENISGMFQKVLGSMQLSQASSLIGQSVSFVPSGSKSAVTEWVQKVTVDDGQVMVHAGGHTVALEDIRSVGNGFGGVTDTEAAGLLGRDITFAPPGETATRGGTVSAVTRQDGQVFLQVDQYLIRPGDVRSVTGDAQTSRQKQAAELLGEHVSFNPPGQIGTRTGVVDTVYIDGNVVYLRSGDHDFTLGDIVNTGN
ncbi:MAG: flagellar hook assembly protein FlgD [Phycisphaerae bacterium]